MNKTISINISGLVFNIEESAFEGLKAYIESIKKYFKQQEGGSEIIADIEARIAEIFSEKLNEERSVITSEDVEFIIANLGQPQEMMDEDEFEEVNEEGRKSFNNASEKTFTKKMYRDPEDKLVAGVASGLSYYLGIDAVWIRLMFVLITLVGTGTGVIIYAILWAVVPEALTTSDKLKMKGKPVNVTNIEQSIKDSFKTISDDLNQFVNDPNRKEKIKRGTNQATSAVGKIVEAVISIIKLVFRVGIRFIAIIFIFAAIMGLVSLSIAFFSSFSIFGFVFNDLLSVAIPSGARSILLMVTILLVAAIPLIILLVRAFQVLLKQGSIAKPVMVTSFVVWIVSVIALFAQITSLGMEVRASAKVDHEIEMKSPGAKRYYIQSKTSSNNNIPQRHYGFNHWSDDDFYFEDDKFFYKDVNFRVETSFDGQFHLIKRYSANGRNYSEAVENANAVEYMIDQTDSSIILSPVLALVDAPFRFQDVTVILKVPEGKEIMFLNHTKDIDNYVGQYANYYYNYPNKVFKMTPNGLEYVAGITKSSVEDGMLSYSYEGFEEITISSEENIKAQVIEGNRFRVLINEELTESRKIDFSTRGNEFRIKIEKEGFSIADAPVHILIEVPSLREFTAEGVGEYLVKTEKSSGYIDINFFGATKGMFDGHIDNLDAKVAGVSELSLKGSVKDLDANIAGTSSLKALEMLAEDVNLDLAGICSAEIYATNRLRIDAGGSSKVKYRGNPNVERNITGLATIEKISD